ncbi:SGNH/GDSL hydrolase family protein [Nocardioides dongkuii]|uniref:SGNH/GDSL hydrolase family protein n=1 Tax=Nocardioides dongkuii TaxID=2760089 RepID=UPI0018784A1B|nr:SGNH/GDSL hydrolase family protein [Nocardioides dongkuii]
MAHGGGAGEAARVSVRGRVLLGIGSALVVVLALTVVLADRAGADLSRCERFAAASAERAEAVTGSGEDLLVIGDSYAAGLRLDRTASSWPSRLPGRVHVAGFSGSGFSATASACTDVSFAARAAAALRRSGAGTVVVEGGLNDHDQSAAAVTAGFRQLMQVLEGRRVVVVGPPAAPARAARVPAVDRLLADLAARHGAAYVATSDLELPYLDDALHLTPEGHRAFGDAVAQRMTQRMAAQLLNAASNDAAGGS